MSFIDEIIGPAPRRGTSRADFEALASIDERANKVAAPAQPDIACRKGCAHCCSVFVSASPTP